MRAAGLLPLLLLLLPLLLGVSSQDDGNSPDPGQNSITKSSKAPVTTKISTTPETTTAKSASTAGTSPSTPAPSPTRAQTTITTTKAGAAQPTVPAATVSTPSSTTATTQSSTTTASPGASPSPSPAAVSPSTAAGNALTARGVSPSTLPSVQASSSHSPTAPKPPPAASSTAAQQPSSTIGTSGGSGTTAAAQSGVTDATSPPGAVGTVGTPSPGTQPQGSQPSPNSIVSTTVLRTDPPQSSKECVDPLSQCSTKQPPSSSSSPVQGPTPSNSSGSTNTSVTPLVGSPSVTTTPMSQPGSKDTVTKAATTTAPGADQSTHGAGSASAKPPSASQSPGSVQTLGPASGVQTDQTESCSSGHQHPNVSVENKLICEDQVQHTRPIIHLKEPRTCDEWRTASNNNSFFESFCSTAQRVFDASRDSCTVTLMACKPSSHHWAVRVVLHFPLDSEEVLMELKEKKDKLEELGIVNITSDKMVEDMTINDEFSTPLIITIITLAGSLLLIAAIYGCHQRFAQKKDQNIHPDVPGFDDGHVALIFNRLTEEMQTMENGYHDNPTLEVMETSSEMQEKKVNLNGELGDSWIVPMDTLMKEDLEEEEDTHL